jgi:hypothetical protein
MGKSLDHGLYTIPLQSYINSTDYLKNKTFRQIIRKMSCIEMK